jgi:predicted phosphodiesterase
MANKPGIGHKVLRELIREFPDAPALTLAKRAYRDHPELWKNLDGCRSTIRTILGLKGKRTRDQITDKSMYRKPRPAGWTGVIPDAIEEIEDWQAVQITEAHRALILSDIHIPYHHVEALEVALNYGEQRKPTLIILNGDLGDHYAESKFEKDPKQKDFPGEVKATKFFLAGLRKRFPRARIVFKLGNHDERYSLYMRMKCPELLGIPDFEFKAVYDLDAMRVEMVDQKRPIRLGKLNIIHGHEYNFAISNPVNPARGFYLRAKSHVLGGHLHRTSQHSEKNVEEKVVSAWSTGCLCGLHPAYSPLNNWNHGFAFVESDGHDFRVDNLRIVDGKAW